MRLTGALVILTGIVNKDVSLGSIQSPKTVDASNGVKVFFSPSSYKSALWTCLEKEKGWDFPIVYKGKKDNSVVQKYGTIIDSIEFDMSGTMVASSSGDNKSDKSNSDKTKNKKTKKQKNSSNVFVSSNNENTDEDAIIDEDAQEVFSKNSESNTKGNNSENYGFVSSIQYSRTGPLAINKAISITNFTGNFTFHTNARIAQLFGINESNILLKPNFYGLYILPLVIDISDVGYQEIPRLATNIVPNDDLKTKIEKLYKALGCVEKIQHRLDKLVEITHSIDYDSKTNTVIIRLTKEEKEKRIEAILRTMGDLTKRIDGEQQNLSPSFAVFSLDFYSTAFTMVIEEKLYEFTYQPASNKYTITPSEELKEALKTFGEKRRRHLYIADKDEYDEVVDKVMEEIKKGLNKEYEKIASSDSLKQV